MALGDNGGKAPNYEPNSYDNAPKQNPKYAEPPMHLGDTTVDRFDHRATMTMQAGDLYRLMNPEQQEQLIENIGVVE